MIVRPLSHYSTTEKLGQGGMREVNRAVDTNLSCHVANKILPEEFAHDAERVMRFCGDAELIALFNPPTSQPYTDWTRPVQARGKE